MRHLGTRPRDLMEYPHFLQVFTTRFMDNFKFQIHEEAISLGIRSEGNSVFQEKPVEYAIGKRSLFRNRLNRAVFNKRYIQMENYICIDTRCI